MQKYKMFYLWVKVLLVCFLLICSLLICFALKAKSERLIAHSEEDVSRCCVVMKSSPMGGFADLFRNEMAYLSAIKAFGCKMIQD